MKNPVWTREELVLVLALYYKLRWDSYSVNHPDVIEMSKLLNSLKFYNHDNRKDNFRNSNGIFLRLQNFRSYDSSIPGIAMKNGGKHARAIWDEFELNQEGIFKEVTQILDTHNLTSKIFEKNSLTDFVLEEVSTYGKEDDECPFIEGSIKYSLHKNIERNSRLIRQIKREAEKNNLLYCHVCNFDFYRVYGELGKGYIECHHSIPISEYIKECETKKEDMILVCANCHRMLHRKRPWVKKEDIHKIIIDNTKE